MDHRTGKLYGAGLALFGKGGHGGAARVGQAEQLGGLVEGLARSVVESLAEKLVAAELLHLHDLGMAARDEKGKKREFGSGIRKTGCKQVPLEVVHAEHGHIERPADGVRNARACEQGAGKSGALRHGDGVDVSAGLARLHEHFVDECDGAPDAVAARKFGHDAAVGAVHVDLGVEGVCEEAVLVGNQGGSRLVAGGFNTEN